MWLISLILYLIGFLFLGGLLFGTFVLGVVGYKLAKQVLKTDPSDW